MKDHDTTGTADQRRMTRKTLEAEIRMRMETTVVTGQSDNISRAGILFYSEEPIRVSIDVEEGGVLRTHHGRLIRLQRISDSNTGLAVEFDPD